MSDSINQIGDKYTDMDYWSGVIIDHWSGTVFEIRFGTALYLAIVLFLAAAVIIGISSVNKNRTAVIPVANDTNVPPLIQDNQDNTANIGAQSEKSENQR